MCEDIRMARQTNLYKGKPAIPQMKMLSLIQCTAWQRRISKMIFTITLNPSLDRTLSIAELHPGMIHRARLMRSDLGGKGINVSRALHALDIPSRILGFSGGRTGSALSEGLLADGFDITFVDTGSEIRQNITLVDESSGLITKINEQGPLIYEQHIAMLEEIISQWLKPGDLWAFCGSPPPGAPADLYARLIHRVQGKKGLAFLDASGMPLHEGVTAIPYALKINSEEAAELLGQRLDGELEICQAAQEIHDTGVQYVLLTRGAQGAVLAMNDEIVVAIPPTSTASSPVGAGDAALAGLLWAVQDQCDSITTARRAVACGTAAAMQPGTGVGERALVLEILAQIHIRLH